MENLIKLKKNDIISFKYGTRRITARVVSNDGANIKWHSLEWSEKEAIIFGYQSLIKRNIIFVGEYRSLFKRLFSFNFSPVEFKS
ncbi:MAG: hypothetical protein SVO01_00765 [Thermotogota bacterium]|nr:hypothetical protein [Thermotogota bacterium]